MKRKALVSAVALVAVLGGSFAAFAAGSGAQDRTKMMDRMGGGYGQMQQMGQRSGMTPFGPEFDFATVDVDEDGKITQEEIDAFKAAQFAKVDANGDGSVDADELYAHQEAQRVERMKARAATMVSNRDTDGNGVLSLEEMGNRPQVSLLDRLDRDGDGALSQEEIAAMGQRMQGRMDGQQMRGEQMRGDRGDMMGRMKGQHGGRDMQHARMDGYGRMQGQMPGQMNGQMNGQFAPMQPGQAPMAAPLAPDAIPEQAPEASGN